MKVKTDITRFVAPNGKLFSWEQVKKQGIKPIDEVVFKNVEVVFVDRDDDGLHLVSATTQGGASIDLTEYELDEITMSINVRS